VKFGDPRALQVVCNAFQSCSPVESYLKPVPAPMPGYASELLMAGGSFVDGSTSEFSADAPLREPYVLFSQGGTHRSHGALALAAALTSWWALAPN
jgi:cystathionine beta-lyase family protein involved in aluminum resistance